jgi:hypothetical protein
MVTSVLWEPVAGRQQGVSPQIAGAYPVGSLARLEMVDVGQTQK